MTIQDIIKIIESRDNLRESGFKLQVTDGKVNYLWLELLSSVSTEKMLKCVGAPQFNDLRRYFYAGVAAGIAELKQQPDNLTLDLELLSECSTFGELVEEGVA